MTQTIYSAFNGVVSLFSEKTRSGFIDALEKGIIQEEVLSQATAGPMVMLSLFHELQNPLFKKSNFDPNEFLENVVPALENFHNVSSALENELHDVIQKSRDERVNEQSNETAETLDESLIDLGADAEAILDYEWINVAREHPDSLAGQLSRMVTSDLFQINQLSSKTAFLLQNQSRNILFREGSCRVHNVALLSARACLFQEKEVPASEDKNDDENAANNFFEVMDYNYGDDYDDSGTAIGAQLEILYDVTQEFAVGESKSVNANELQEKSSGNQSGSEEYTQTTIVSVATLEGWLHGGPDGGELRWKMAAYRPPYEFPGIDHAY
eukprot:jgi/Psemu1/243782/estExt_Genewise1.C_3850021